MTVTRSVSRWSPLALALGSVSYACLLFVWFLPPAFLSPVIDALALANWQAGVLAGAVPLTSIPLSLVSGLALDRVGPRWGIGAGLLVFGAAGAARGLATGFASMLALTLLVGVGATGITFGLPELVAALFPRERIGSASTVSVLGSYAGSAGAFAIGRPVLGPALGGWRPAFVYSGLAVVAFVPVWFLGTARIEPPNGDDDRGFSLGSLREDADRVLSNPGMLLLVAIGTAYLLVNHGLQGWLVTVFETRGVRPALAGLTTTVLVAGQVVGVGPLLRAIPVELEGIGPGLTATAVGFVFAVGEVGGFLGSFLVGSLRDAPGSFAPGLAVIVLAASPSSPQAGG